MPSAIDYLISSQHESGGWGYSTGQRPGVEPTAAVLLATRNESSANNSFQNGLSWLLQCQHQDGGWGINEDDPESGWQTAWALIALRYSTQNNIAIAHAVDWLTTVETYEVSREQFQKPEIPQTASIGALVWPWMPGQLGFIEPTAMAILALEGVNQSQQTDARFISALNFFQHNRTPHGGWDYGNEGKLDTGVLPRAYPTALTLIALTHIANDKVLNIDTIALQKALSKDPSILVQSSGALALRTMGVDSKALISSITDRQLQNGSWVDNPFFTAWALMAIRGYL